MTKDWLKSSYYDASLVHLGKTVYNIQALEVYATTALSVHVTS